MTERTITPDPAIICEIEYEDAEGTTTRREIEIEEITVRDDCLLLYAYCGLRDDYRYFRSDRVQEVITEDGECLPPDVFFSAHGIAIPHPKKPKASKSKSHDGKLRLALWTLAMVAVWYLQVRYSSTPEDKSLAIFIAVFFWIIGVGIYFIFRGLRGIIRMIFGK